MKQFIWYLKKLKKKNYVVIIVALMAVTIMFSNMICDIVFASSANGNRKEKGFFSIKIEEGDTLWEIAEEHYRNSGQDTIGNYIKEIKRCNGLSGDVIHEGNYLIIPYWSSEK